MTDEAEAQAAHRARGIVLGVLAAVAVAFIAGFAGLIVGAFAPESAALGLLLAPAVAVLLWSGAAIVWWKTPGFVAGMGLAIAVAIVTIAVLLASGGL